MASRGGILGRLRPDYVTFEGYRLPLPRNRLNGAPFQNDRYYLDSCLAEARRVIDELGCRDHSRVLDLGCGQGRLATALTRVLPRLDYLGLDVSVRYVSWCRRHIRARYPSYDFDALDLVNSRYNPSGPPLTKQFGLPFDAGALDIVYMWGVVTNMEPEHLPPYAAEIARVLTRGGRLFVTAHVEPGVPPSSLNPEGYVPWTCAGPLHVVRYEEGAFLETFERQGLRLVQHGHHAATLCQSEFYFTRG